MFKKFLILLTVMPLVFVCANDFNPLVFPLDETLKKEYDSNWSGNINSYLEFKSI